MTINLNWQTGEDPIYGQIHSAEIWQNQTLEIRHNGENWYNVELFDQYGNEIDAICGSNTIDGAKLATNNWLKQQIQPLISETLT